MTEELRNKIYSSIVKMDGIEKTEEIINAIEYLEMHPPNEKVNTIFNWQFDSIQSAHKEINSLINLIKSGEKLNFSLFTFFILSTIVNLIFIVLFFIK